MDLIFDDFLIFNYKVFLEVFQLLVQRVHHLFEILNFSSQHIDSSTEDGKLVDGAEIADVLVIKFFAPGRLLAKLLTGHDTWHQTAGPPRGWLKRLEVWAKNADAEMRLW